MVYVTYLDNVVSSLDRCLSALCPLLKSTAVLAKSKVIPALAMCFCVPAANCRSRLCAGADVRTKYAVSDAVEMAKIYTQEFGASCWV